MKAKEKRPELKSSSLTRSFSKFLAKVTLLLIVLNSTLEAPGFKGYKQT